MSFFDRFPPPEPPEVEPANSPPPWAKPDAVIGGAVATREMLLGRGEDAVVGLSGLTAYANGFSFSIVAILRREDRRGQTLHLAFHRDFLEGEPPGPGFLRLGVQFADGAAASNLGGLPHAAYETEPAGPMLIHDSGGGGQRRWEMRYWLWPLPPPGPVTFVCEWPAYGITESRAEVDASLIIDAAARATDFWP